MKKRETQNVQRINGATDNRSFPVRDYAQPRVKAGTLTKCTRPASHPCSLCSLVILVELSRKVGGDMIATQVNGDLLRWSTELLKDSSGYKQASKRDMGERSQS